MHRATGRQDSPRTARTGDAGADAVPGGWTVHPYDEDVQDLLRAEVARLAPTRVLVDFAPDDPLADGLTHGLYLRLREHLPGFDAVNAQDLYRGVNAVKRTLVRTEADETTYNLHVALRFELELALRARETSPGSTSPNGLASAAGGPR